MDGTVSCASLSNVKKWYQTQHWLVGMSEYWLIWRKNKVWDLTIINELEQNPCCKTHREGYFVCPSTRTTCLCFEKDRLFVPQKGQVICPSKRTTCLSLKKDKLFVPQKGQLACYSKGQLVCPSKWKFYLSEYFSFLESSPITPKCYK